MKMADTERVWTPAPDVLDLGSHQVDIWRVPLDLQSAAVKSLASTLSVDESQRAARFHFPEDRVRYIIAHGSLRIILSRYLNCGPNQLSFSVNEFGKPALDSHNLEFNLSHSGDFALIAVSGEQKVGVDVERIRSDMELESMARRFFSPDEVSELMALPPEERDIGFFNCWTRKEAYIKAQGLGLSLPLDSFDVSLTSNEPAILRATRPNPMEAARWTLVSMDVETNYAAAVAVEMQGVEFRLWIFNLVG